MRKQGKYLVLITMLFILEDLFVLNLLFFIMSYIFGVNFGQTYQFALLLINLGYLLGFTLIRVDFNDVKQLHVPLLLRRNFYKLAITLVILLSGLFSIKVSDVVSRLYIGTFFSFACILMTCTQLITRKALTYTFRHNFSKGIILGAGTIGKRIFDEMLRNIYNNVIILGLFDDNPDKNNKGVDGNIEEAKDYILQNGISYVFCALPHSADDKIRDFIKFCESNVINFLIVPGIEFYDNNKVGNIPIVEYIGKIPVFVLRNLPLSYLHNALIKRSIDLIFSLIAVLILFPILFPILSILIKLSSPGPVIFKQKRTGKRGEEFFCYKFRTMKCSADAHTKQATKDDDRKTKIGDFLRKTSLDELPQFINVLIGNMSLVGPRPHMLQHTYDYSPKVDKYMVRHFAKPGITGLAQVTGFRGETKDIELMEKRILADIEYIENWTWKLDFKIMFKTVAVILKGDKNAY